MHTTRFVTLSVLMICSLLAACGRTDNSPMSGNVKLDEARELEKAAVMLDAQRVDASVAAADADVVTGDEAN